MKLRNTGRLVEVEQILARKVSKGTIPGISIIVIKNGQQVYQSHMGWSDKPKRKPTSQETVYHWWSLTKIATAIAILQLHDKGQINIDDPASNYLPFIDLKFDDRPAPRITIRQLLRHTSGLPDTMPAMIGWVHYENRLEDQTALLRRVIPGYKKLKFIPDTQVAYSNLGYMVLGAIIESVTGKSYENYIHKNILAPLGMSRTGFLYSDNVKENAAAGSHPLMSIYTPLLPFLLDIRKLVRSRTGTRLWFNPVYLDPTPPSGLIGSASDAAKLAASLLERDQLLTKESHNLMLPKGKPPAGWPEYNLSDRLWMQHQGGGPGFATLMRIYPDENLGVVIMTNTTHLRSSDLADAYAQRNW